MPRAPVIITEEDALYRRIPPDFYKADGKVSSAAFKDKESQPSVDLKRLTTVDQSLDIQYRQRGFYLAELSASVPLRLGLEVSHDPTPENIAHCVIRRFKQIENFSERVLRKLLAEACTIIVKPESCN